MPDQKPAKPAGPNVFVPKNAVPSFDELLPETPDGLACVCNDAIASGEGTLRYQKALERGGITTEQVMEAPFAAKWFYVFRVESRDDQGTTKGEHFRIVFMSPAGTTYETHSETAIQTLRGWIALRGWLPWDPPIGFSVEQKKGSSGHTYHRLTTVIKNGSPKPPVKS